MLSSSFAQCYFKHDSNVTDDIARTESKLFFPEGVAAGGSGAVQCTLHLGLARP